MKMVIIFLIYSSVVSLVKVFTVTFDQFNASLLNKTIDFLKQFRLIFLYCCWQIRKMSCEDNHKLQFPLMSALTVILS